MNYRTLTLTTFALVLLAVLMVSVRACSAQWFDYSPAGSINGEGILRDVWSRADNYGRQEAYEPSEVTYCHELTHMVNSRIHDAIGARGKRHAMYVGGGRCCVLDEPRVTFATVAQYVPQQQRNSTYRLYFIDSQSAWNDRPLYLLNEWVAYANGSQAARELGAEPHGTYERTLRFCVYADALIEAVRRHDPQYPQLNELVAFVAWHKQRSAALANPQQVAHR